MKKLLGILVLGLLFSGNAYAEKIRITCSFEKSFYMNFKSKEFGKTYRQADLSDVYEDFYFEVEYENKTLKNFNSNYGVSKDRKLKDFKIEDAYFLLTFNTDSYGIYETIFIDRYNGSFKHSTKSEKDSGYELTNYYKCQNATKKF